jgi:hypothetical protein
MTRTLRFLAAFALAALAATDSLAETAAEPRAASAVQVDLAAVPAKSPRRGPYAGPVYLVPNFHPASCGWLTDFSTERNYCANSYLDHLDRVRDDPNYCFALSEVNNLMAIMEFEPQRVAELKERIRQGRVELCSAFFLEPTINLSGGEALVKMGVEGLRWQEQVIGVRPRLVWAIDVTGVHEQMGQITAGLNLDGMVYTRDNPTSSVLHWLESPDGTRALGISPGHYSEWEELFNSRAPLAQAQVEHLAADVQAKARRTPAGVPVLVLGGGGDYALPPACKSYPAEFLAAWKRIAPSLELRFTGPGKYLDAVGPVCRKGLQRRTDVVAARSPARQAGPTDAARLAALDLPVTRSGARLSWTSFWIQCPKVKAGYRHAEHSLQSAEAAATVASLKAGLQLTPCSRCTTPGWKCVLNMDRNTLWGAAGGMVFEDPALVGRPRPLGVGRGHRAEGLQQAALRSRAWAKGRSRRAVQPAEAGGGRAPVRLRLSGGRSGRLGSACQAEARRRGALAAGACPRWAWRPWSWSRKPAPAAAGKVDPAAGESSRPATTPPRSTRNVERWSSVKLKPSGPGGAGRAGAAGGGAGPATATTRRARPAATSAWPTPAQFPDRDPRCPRGRWPRWSVVRSSFHGGGKARPDPALLQGLAADRLRR